MKKPKRKVKRVVPVIVTQDNLHAIEYLPSDTIIHAFKATTKKGTPPVQNDDVAQKIVYAAGYTYTEHPDDCDFTNNSCGRGLNVSTLKWIKKETFHGNGILRRVRGLRLFIVQFTPEDIVRVPSNSDGKFRLKKFAVIRELKNPSLKKLK